jgi:hypothetical protein
LLWKIELELEQVFTEKQAGAVQPWSKLTYIAAWDIGRILVDTIFARTFGQMKKIQQNQPWTFHCSGPDEKSR